MLALFDMGKYNFYVWVSITLFFIMIVIDLISIWNQRKHLKQRIKARQRRAKS